MAGLIATRNLWVFWLGLAFLASAGLAQGRLDEYRAKFQRETDPVGKARALPKYGEALLDQAGQQLQANEVDAALKTLEQYREAVSISYSALKASGINAEKKPNGFKQLEIHVRRGARRLEDLIVNVPFERRKPFEDVQKQLEQTDHELIEMLFPRRPAKTESKPKS